MIKNKKYIILLLLFSFNIFLFSADNNIFKYKLIKNNDNNNNFYNQSFFLKSICNKDKEISKSLLELEVYKYRIKDDNDINRDEAIFLEEKMRHAGQFFAYCHLFSTLKHLLYHIRNGESIKDYIHVNKYKNNLFRLAINYCITSEKGYNMIRGYLYDFVDIHENVEIFKNKALNSLTNLIL